MRLHGQRALVTGSSKGLGLAIAHCLVDLGCQVFTTARNPELLNAIDVELASKGNGRGNFVAGDLRSPDGCQLLVNEIHQRGFYPSIIIHNLGGALGHKEILDSSASFFESWQFNAGIQIELNRYLVPNMIEQRYGRIVSISSAFSQGVSLRKDPYGGALSYNAAKAYVNAYNSGLARELASFGVVVSTVLPGVIDSPGKHWDKLRKSNKPLFDSFVSSHISAGRLADFHDVTPLIALLASEEARYFSGFVGNVDGGLA